MKQLPIYWIVKRGGLSDVWIQIGMAVQQADGKVNVVFGFKKGGK